MPEFVQILVLAVIALFLVLRLRNVLGTRTGFEKPTELSTVSDRRSSDDRQRPDLRVVDDGPDEDIAAFTDPEGDTGLALAEIKKRDRNFSVAEFMTGAKSAYEMILMGYENGDVRELQPFMSEDVHDGFAEAIEARRDAGLTVEAHFIGVREVKLTDAGLDEASGLAEITIRFVGELTSVVRNSEGEVVEGNANEVRRQTDIFTFEREIASKDPNWTLVATGE